MNEEELHEFIYQHLDEVLSTLGIDDHLISSEQLSRITELLTKRLLEEYKISPSYYLGEFPK